MGSQVDVKSGIDMSCRLKIWQSTNSNTHLIIPFMVTSKLALLVTCLMQSCIPSMLSSTPLGWQIVFSSQLVFKMGWDTFWVLKRNKRSEGKINRSPQINGGLEFQVFFFEHYFIWMFKVLYAGVWHALICYLFVFVNA